MNDFNAVLFDTVMSGPGAAVVIHQRTPPSANNIALEMPALGRYEVFMFRRADEVDLGALPVGFSKASPSLFLKRHTQ